MKLIGISSSASENRLFTNRAYSSALTRPGVTPVMLPLFPIIDRELGTQAEYAATHKAHIDALVDRLDGYVASGGPDLQPLHYDEPNWGSVSVDSERDFMEYSLIDAFIAAGKPILGICRGYQAINTRLGVLGFLQDLEVTGELHNAAERDIKDRAEPAHSVYVYGDYQQYLRERTGRHDLTKVLTTSWHHQGWCLTPDGKLPGTFKGRVMKKWRGDEWAEWFTGAIAAFEQANDIKVLSSTNMVIEGVEKAEARYVGWAGHPEEHGPKSAAIQYWLDAYVL